MLASSLSSLSNCDLFSLLPTTNQTKQADISSDQINTLLEATGNTEVAAYYPIIFANFLTAEKITQLIVNPITGGGGGGGGGAGGGGDAGAGEEEKKEEAAVEEEAPPAVDMVSCCWRFMSCMFICIFVWIVLTDVVLTYSSVEEEMEVIIKDYVHDCIDISNKIASCIFF